MVDTSDPALQESWDDLTDSKTDTNWVVWGFDEKEKNKVVFFSKGNGGLKEFVAQLNPDQILFGGFQVTGVDQGDNVTSRRPKFIAVTFIGENVGAMKKGRVSVQRPIVQKLMRGMTCAIDSPPDDLDMEGIAKTLLRAGGAHKPTHYDFGPEQMYELEK